MFYLIGSKDARESWKKSNRIPYFDIEEQDAYDDVSCLHDQTGDEHVTLYVNLECEKPLFTLQITSEEGGVESEMDFSCYDEALEAYDQATKPTE